MSSINAPRLLFSGIGGDSGKTLAALGYIRIKRRAGTAVQPFKKGPDYIDPAWLSRAAGRPARNLDSCLMGHSGVVRAFTRHALADGLNVIEGNRGLYDAEDRTGLHSTAELAKTLNAPVILILPVTKMTRTAAAVVLGMARFDPEVRIAGVILNRVAGSRHERVIRQAIGNYTGIPVVGALPNVPDSPLAGRHLGLVTPEEHEAAERAIERAAEIMAAYTDIAGLDAISATAPAVDFEPVTPDVEIPVRTVTIGWFTGSAFTFYYPDNLEALEQSGAKLIPIDPVSDKELPDMDALYIGGGFPETHGTLLAGNKPFKQMLRAACQAGLPVWAECGGLMYLAQELIWDESRYEMAGVLPVSVAMNPKPQGHGYMETTVDAPNPFFPVGTRIKGHEFHYSRIITSKDITTVLAVERGTGIGGHRDGIVTGNVVANYVHIHAAATPEWTAGLIAAATNYHNYKHCL